VPGSGVTRFISNHGFIPEGFRPRLRSAEGYPCGSRISETTVCKGWNDRLGRSLERVRPKRRLTRSHKVTKGIRNFVALGEKFGCGRFYPGRGRVAHMKPQRPEADPRLPAVAASCEKGGRGETEVADCPRKGIPWLPGWGCGGISLKSMRCVVKAMLSSRIASAAFIGFEVKLCSPPTAEAQRRQAKATASATWTPLNRGEAALERSGDCRRKIARRRQPAIGKLIDDTVVAIGRDWQMTNAETRVWN